MIISVVVSVKQPRLVIRKSAVRFSRKGTEFNIPTENWKNKNMTLVVIPYPDCF